MGVENVKAKAAWMQRVIEEEQAKPLQVTKDFVLEYQENERREEERLDAEVARHIECLRKLRVQIEKRESLRGTEGRLQGGAQADGREIRRAAGERRRAPGSRRTTTSRRPWDPSRRSRPGR